MRPKRSEPQRSQRKAQPGSPFRRPGSKTRWKGGGAKELKEVNLPFDVRRLTTRPFATN